MFIAVALANAAAPPITAAAAMRKYKTLMSSIESECSTEADAITVCARRESRDRLPLREDRDPPAHRRKTGDIPSAAAALGAAAHGGCKDISCDSEGANLLQTFGRLLNIAKGQEPDQ